MRLALTALLILLAATPTAHAAKPPPPSCSWHEEADGWHVTAVNLDPGRTVNLTFSLRPSGGGWTVPSSGVLSWGPNWHPLPVTAYWWQRQGGGKTLIKAGPQLSDYKVIALCTLEAS